MRDFIKFTVSHPAFPDIVVYTSVIVLLLLAVAYFEMDWRIVLIGVAGGLLISQMIRRAKR